MWIKNMCKDMYFMVFLSIMVIGSIAFYNFNQPFVFLVGLIMIIPLIVVREVTYRRQLG